MSIGLPITGDSFTLFVYGTLKRGGVRHPFLAGQIFLGEARTLPRYALFDLVQYPGLVRCETAGRCVRGELYRVETRMIPRLDQVEGAPTVFRLEPIFIEGVDEPVFAYLYQRSTQGRTLCDNDCWVNG
ncbi:MAG TPA: gamma-glutamylcyclotransferase family protein [Gemmataceae bacterium]|jgi:gamma-glutamylcyclotransferase (GGCT)/AIG2-like uncharacterized protein YtfP|nr:gamma-glutamylcyclotransferase family protein [Gemmataceae bacterium]